MRSEWDEVSKTSEACESKCTYFRWQIASSIIVTSTDVSDRCTMGHPSINSCPEGGWGAENISLNTVEFNDRMPWWTLNYMFSACKMTLPLFNQSSERTIMIFRCGSSSERFLFFVCSSVPDMASRGNETRWWWEARMRRVKNRLELISNARNYRYLERKGEIEKLRIHARWIVS